MAKWPPKHHTTVEREAYGQTIEVPILVEYTYEPEERCIMWGENAQPGCSASVEIDIVTVEATGKGLILTDEETDWVSDEIIDSYED